MSKAQNYWSHTGKHQQLYNALFELVPEQGEVQGKENKALEKMRKSSGAYYDLFNNGLCNRASQFRAVFGFGGKAIADVHHFDMDCVLALRMEALCDQFILDAWEEQKGKIIPVLEAKIEEAKQSVLQRAANLQTEPFTEHDTLDWRISNLGYRCKRLQELKDHLYAVNYRLRKEAEIEDEIAAKRASLK